MTLEEWRPIPGFDHYLVSDLGRIMRVKPSGNRRPGQLLKTPPDSRGYAVIGLWDGTGRAGRKSVKVHRLVLLAFVGEPGPDEEACHNNGISTDNRLENLRWGTHSENIRDAIAHGTHSEARKTQCKRGHPFDEKNTAMIAGRKRNCRKCRAMATAAYAARRKAAK